MSIRSFFGRVAELFRDPVPAAPVAIPVPVSVVVAVPISVADPIRWIDLCRPLVQLSEGCRLRAYWDAGGACWTIGWGETGHDIVEGLVWTQEIADARLDARLKLSGIAIDAAVAANMAPHEKAALVSIHYNVGGGRASRGSDPGRDGIVVLKSGRPSTLLRKLNAGDRAGCADQFPLWNRSGGQVLAGLAIRRARERSLFLTGFWK